MKKIHFYLCAVLFIAALSACGNKQSQPNPADFQTPTISLEEYKTKASDFNSRVMDESLLLANVGMYEFNFWKTYENLPAYGDLNYENMVNHAMEWLADNSDANADSLNAGYDALISAYADIADANVDGGTPDDISDYAAALFGAYNELYNLVTSPSGKMEDFAVSLRDHSSAITTFNADLSNMLEK